MLIRPPLHIATVAPVITSALNSAAHWDYESKLTVTEKDKKAAQINSCIDRGDPAGMMSAYQKTVPFIVEAVLANRFEGAPFPWAVAAPVARPVKETVAYPDGWFEPVLSVPTAPPVAVDQSAVDDLFAELDGK